MLAMTHSSSVRIMCTEVLLVSEEITPAFATLRFSSSSMPRKPSPVADPRSDGRRVFTDAPCEDQRVQAAERRREGPDPFLDLVAKERDRFSRSDVMRFTAEQVMHVGARLLHAE